MPSLQIPNISVKLGMPPGEISLAKYINYIDPLVGVNERVTPVIAAFKTTQSLCSVIVLWTLDWRVL